MIDNGMQKAGWSMVSLDDCWEATERDADGNIMGDPARFPSGMAELANWLHARNFTFGIYTSLGWETCSKGGRVGCMCTDFWWPPLHRGALIIAVACSRTPPSQVLSTTTR
jgi:hypothetical protein